MRKPYPTDLSDVEWKCLESHMPAPKERGRPRVHPFREILNAIFYVLKTGCLDAGYLGWGEEWAEEVLDLSVEIVHRSPKPQPEKVMRM